MEINKVTNNTVYNISKVSNVSNYNKIDMDGSKRADNDADDKNISKQAGIGRNIDIQA